MLMRDVPPEFVTLTAHIAGSELYGQRSGPTAVEMNSSPARNPHPYGLLADKREPQASLL